MYEEAAACEDKDVEEVKSAHLTASFLPKLKSDRCFLPFSRLTRDIFRRSFWRGHFYLFRFAVMDFTQLALTSADFHDGRLPRGFYLFRFWHLLYYLKVTWQARFSKLPSDMAQNAFAPFQNATCQKQKFKIVTVSSRLFLYLHHCKEQHFCENDPTCCCARVPENT